MSAESDLMDIEHQGTVSQLVRASDGVNKTERAQEQRFVLLNKSFTQQFNHVYSKRSSLMRETLR
jgi:hypothetical protein